MYKSTKKRTIYAMKEKLNVNRIPELKQEILDLTEKEKNQLLIRLINKDQLLIEQLHFRLLENEFDLIQRFEDLKQEIDTTLQQNLKNIINARFNSGSKLYLKLLRSLSGKINHFAKVTKSFENEIELRTFLLIESSKLYKKVQNEDSVFGFKTRIYQATRVKAILKLWEKLHEDLQYDFTLNYTDDLQLYVVNSLKSELTANNIDLSKIL